MDAVGRLEAWFLLRFAVFDMSSLRLFVPVYSFGKCCFECNDAGTRSCSKHGHMGLHAECNGHDKLSFADTQYVAYGVRPSSALRCEAGAFGVSTLFGLLPAWMVLQQRAQDGLGADAKLLSPTWNRLVQP